VTTSSTTVLLADVNIFLYAHRPESPRFDEHRAWLAKALSGREPFGVSEAVLASFLRIVTNFRVYREPTPPGLALDFCTAVLEAPAAVAVRPGIRHWGLFVDLCRAVGARANVVPDAFLAALAVEHGATWVTTDRGFARFPGLRWGLPLDRA
jgi:toxin-antitoxin system PIN domain toxin